MKAILRSCFPSHTQCKGLRFRSPVNSSALTLYTVSAYHPQLQSAAPDGTISFLLNPTLCVLPIPATPRQKQLTRIQTPVPWEGDWDTQGKAQRLEMITLEPGED